MREQLDENTADGLRSIFLAQLLPMLQQAIIESLEDLLQVLNAKEGSVRVYAQNIQTESVAFRRAENILNVLEGKNYGAFEALGPLVNIATDIAQSILAVSAEVSDAKRERLRTVVERMIALLSEDQQLFTESGCMQAGDVLMIKGILHRALGAIPDEENLTVKVLRGVQAGVARRIQEE